MRVVTTQQLEQDPSLMDEAIEILRSDGLVCFPGHRQYSIAASLMSPEAVIALVQSKRRSGKAPSLVLIPDQSQLADVVEEIPHAAKELARAFWPGPLTLVLRPNPNLPAKVRKTIAAAKPPRIGVRLPGSGMQRTLVERFGGPLLVSSANLSQKVGSCSASNVRKNFNHTVDFMFDAGDVPENAPSTIVSLLGSIPEVTREGRIPASKVLEVIRSVGVGDDNTGNSTNA